ncbi:MAG: PorV/PorQ family protein [bacterium]
MSGTPVAVRSVAALLLAPALALASVEIFDDARVAAPYLTIGSGARASAMGEAFSAIADDSTAVFWNPAGLAQIGRAQGQFTHSQWIGGFRHEFFGGAFPAGGTFGFAASVLDLGSFDQLDGAGARIGQAFDVSGRILMGGYGRALLDDALLVGVAAKTLNENLGGGIGGRTVSADAGVLVVPWLSAPGLALAGVVQNIGGELAGFRLPLTGRAGAAWRWPGLFLRAAGLGSESRAGPVHRYPWESDEPADELTAAAEVLVPRRGRVEVHAGAEYWLMFAAIRAGYRYRYPANELGGLSGLTLGLGIHGHGFQFDYGFDYAFAPYGDLGDASRFTLLVSF